MTVACTICAREFTLKKNLNRHMRNFHASKEVVSAENSLLTNNVETSSVNEVETPNGVLMNTVETTNDAPAESVKERPRYSELVNDDVIFEHGCEVLECDECEMYFTTQEQLERHEVV